MQELFMMNCIVFTMIKFSFSLSEQRKDHPNSFAKIEKEPKINYEFITEITFENIEQLRVLMDNDPYLMHEKKQHMWTILCIIVTN